jgi:hypothetical protein
MTKRPIDSKLAKFLANASIPVLVGVVLLASVVGVINAVLTAEVAKVAGFSIPGTIVLTILAGGLSFVFTALFGLVFSAVATFIGSIFYTLLFKKDDPISTPLPYGRNNPCWGLDPRRRRRSDDTEVVEVAEVVEVVEEPVDTPVPAVRDDSKKDGVGPVARVLETDGTQAGVGPVARVLDNGGNASADEGKPADQPKP